MKEDYVSFEIAKLLKEKGFPQEYDIYHSLVYNEEDYEDEYEVQRMVLETKLVKAGTLSSYPVGVPEPKCFCPSLSMTMKWLREEYNIHIEIHYLHESKDYSYVIDYVSIGGIMCVNGFDSYENAVEAAIKYCLTNLI